MASKIVRHEYDGFFISQRIDGFVNLTQMAKAHDCRVSDFLDVPRTIGYIAALAKDLGKLPSDLVVTKEGRNGGTWAHPEIAIKMAQWLSYEFEIWANRTLRGVIENAFTGQFDRVLDFPTPGSPAFEDWFEREVAKVTGLHKNDIRNGKFYWEFVYYWLTEEERAKLNEINPVLPNGRRKYKIHDCLTPETKIRLAPFQLKLMGKLESANTVDELRRMVQRASGVDQPNLFDGWDWEDKDDSSKAS